MFESELTNILVSSATTLLYIAGLVGIVAWLKGVGISRANSPPAQKS